MNAGKILDRRVALVTGASRGIGRFIAQRLASAGATVVVTARSVETSVARSRQDRDRVLPGTLLETVALIEREGGTAVPIGCDLLDDEDRAALIPRVEAAAGPIDILINNAGFCTFEPFEQMSLADFDLTFTHYLRVPIILTKAVLPGMKARRRGWIVNISSAGAVPPPRPFGRKPPGNLAYAAAKAALNRFTQGLAEEVVVHNIAVNAVAPSTFIISPGSAEVTAKLVPPDMEGEDPAYIAATVLAMCQFPAAERTGLIAYSMHYPHEQNIPVFSLDGGRRLPDLSPSAHPYWNIAPAGDGRAYGAAVRP